MSSQMPPAIHRERVKVRMKWFNQTKGFGFVQIEGEDGDAFLHASMVTHDQVGLMLPGTTLLCDLAKGQRGLVVAAVYEIDPSTADPNEAPPKREGGGGGRRNDYDHGDDDGPTETVEGIVKFYNSGKGYGFMQSDQGGPDIFLPGRVMEQAGLNMVEPDTRLRVETRNGPRGKQAEKVELLKD